VRLRDFVLIALIGVLLVGCGTVGRSTSSDVVEEFEEEGLTVVDPRPVQDEDLGMAPQTFDEGTHFVASTEEDLGAKVFTYESEDDLRQMQTFYESFSGMFYSHVYTNDLMLLQINGQLPKSEADRYGEILEEM
jgi:hypothetical protein